MGKFLIQPHVRLQEWVAEELGFFREAGLDYEFSRTGSQRRSGAPRHRCRRPTTSLSIAEWRVRGHVEGPHLRRELGLSLGGQRRGCHERTVACTGTRTR